MTKNQTLSSPSKSVRSNPLDALSFSDDPLLYKKLFGYISDEIIVTDKMGKVVFINGAAAGKLGGARKNILGRKFVHFLNEKISSEQWKKKYFDVLKKTKAPKAYSIEYLTEKKEVRTVDITSVYMKYADRECVFSIGRDVTRRVELQRALEHSKDLYRFLAEGTKEGIAALDSKGRFIYVNSSLKKMLGNPPGGYQGQYFHRFISKSVLAKAKKVFNKTRQDKKYVRDTVDGISVSGKVVPMEVSLTPMLKSGKVVSIHVLVRDLRISQKIEDMNREAEKMEALQYFMAGTAQELKNPLLGISKRTETLLKKYAKRNFEYLGYKDFKDIISTVQSINDHIQYCYDTSRRLMAMAQKKAGIHKGHCPADRLIQNVVKDKEWYMHQHEIQPRLALIADNVDIRMSPVDFGQVLHNLIDNAIQAMPSGGLLSIKTSLSKTQDALLLEIKDCGVGIPKDQLRHIFEPFFTTKTRGIKKNSGLGLPIAYALVHESQGDIQVSSSLRKGTRVLVSLPVYRPRRKK